MPRKCSICTHNQRQEIENNLLAGESFRNIAKQYGTSAASLHRHMTNCVPGVMAKAANALEISVGDDLFAKMAELEQKANEIGQKAENKGDLKTALAAVRELTRIIELQAKMMGEIKEQSVNVLVTSPDWLSMRTRLLKALEPYDEARRAVVDAFTEGRYEAP